MKILCIDTSSKLCGVAILDDTTLIKKIELDNGLTHSESLMPLIDQILKECNLSLKDINLLVSDIGPGSFTGIRIGIATIKAFADSLNIPMSEAGPISTITIAVSSFIGVILGGILSDRWVQKNIRGRVYTGAIGLGMTIPALLLLGFGHSFVSVIGAGLLFGIGFGIFDANNMPILCQFVSAKHRATAYGIMNMTGVFAGAAVTEVLGKWTDGGSLGQGFAMLSIVVAVALVLQIYFLRPKTDNMVD